MSFIFVASLFLSIAQPYLCCDAANSISNVNTSSEAYHFQRTEIGADGFLRDGFINLFERDPGTALKNLDEAEWFNEPLSQEEEAHFLIHYGKVIAYDQLGLKSLSFRHLELLKDVVRGGRQEESSDVAITQLECLEALEFINDIISLSPSLDIQQSLYAFTGGRE